MEFGDLILSPTLDNVLLTTTIQGADPETGTLCITSHHLIFSTRRDDIPELWVSTELISTSRRSRETGVQSYFSLPAVASVRGSGGPTTECREQCAAGRHSSDKVQGSADNLPRDTNRS